MAFLDHFFGVGDALVRQFANVHQAFDCAFDACECAKTGQASDLTFHQLANSVFLVDDRPGFGQQLAQAQTDTATISIDTDDFDIDRVSDAHYFTRVLDATPREFGKVNQAIGAAEIDKGAKGSEATNLTATSSANFQFTQQFFFLLSPPVAHGLALRQNQAITTTIDFDDFQVQFVANKVCETIIRVLAFASFIADKLRCRHKAASLADEDNDAAFVVATDLSFENFAAIHQISSVLPIVFGESAGQRKDGVSISTYRSDDLDKDGVAILQVVADFIVDSIQVAGRNNSL